MFASKMVKRKIEETSSSTKTTKMNTESGETRKRKSNAPSSTSKQARLDADTSNSGVSLEQPATFHSGNGDGASNTEPSLAGVMQSNLPTRQSLTQKRIRGKQQCPTCQKEFSSKHMARHRKLHEESCYDCSICQYRNCKNFEYFRQHYRKQHAKENHYCPKCEHHFNSEEEFLSQEHVATCLKYAPDQNQPQPLEPLPPNYTPPTLFHDSIHPPERDSPFWQDPVMQPYIDETDLIDLIGHYWSCFRQCFETNSNLVNEFYYRTIGADATVTLSDAMKHTYSMINVTYNFNVGITTLLKRQGDNDQNEYRIFTAQSQRQNLFDKNVLIYDLASLDSAIKKIDFIGDLNDHVQRPGSDWNVVAVLGLTFYCYLRPQFVAGRGQSRLPTWLACNKKSLIAMERDCQWNLYTDSLCVIRCIVAAQKGDYQNLTVVQEAYEKYRIRVNGPTWDKFKGVPDDHWALIEQIFNINIQIYRKSSPKNVTCLRKATEADPNRVTINLHSHPIDSENVHMSLITNLNNFCGRHLCEGCNRMFRLHQQLVKHQQNSCSDGETKHAYKDGCYEAPRTIFDQLSEMGIFIEHDRRLCIAFIVWDLEATLQPLQERYQLEKMDEPTEIRLNNQNIETEYVDKAKGLQFRERHKPITGAIKSTVPGYEHVQFFHNENGNLLLQEIFQAMNEISDRNYELQCEAFSVELTKLNNALKTAETALENADEKNKRKAKSNLKKIQRLVKNFDRYLRVCSVLSLNGGRYDLNLCKAELFPCMTKEVRKARNDATNDGTDGSRSWPKAITRGSSILSLETEKLKFLDICYYAPGTSLDRFIKAYNPDGDTKGAFPFALLRSLEDLHNITEFPTQSAFYLTLKGAGIDDKSYQDAKAIWDALPEPRTMFSYLRWYNSRDVDPFAIACTNMLKIFWANFRVDVYKQAISVPGVCLTYLFQTLHEQLPTAHFGLFSESEADLCQELYSSMTGGLATIVTRLAEKGKTKIRGGDNIVKKVIGLDYNALYLDAMSNHDMPTGYCTHWTANKEGTFERKSETVEEKLKHRRSHGEVHFMKYAAYRDNVYIHSSLHGSQSRLGTRQWPVDGYAKDAKPRPRVYEYFGCQFHFHQNGCLNKNVQLTDANQKQAELDIEKEKELRELGFEYQVTWECQFQAAKQLARNLNRGRPIPAGTHPSLLEEAKKYAVFLKEHPDRKFQSEKQIAYQKMFDAVMQGEVFGFVKADVKVKENKREEYSDFPPIIKNTMVGREDIGDFMRGIAEESGQLETPRRCLINSYFAEDTWIMSPLLVWYHSRDMEITIKEVAQFDRQNVFDWFGKQVTHHRKAADADKSKKLLGEVYKLLGNSAYGKTITNLGRHMQVYYTDSAEMQTVHNDPFHHKTVKITDDCFEVHKRKDTIEFNLPLQIGLSVYAYAKLKVLRFIFEVLQEYIPRDHYLFLESDTDSIYLAICENSLKECVPKEKMAEFEKVEANWFVLDDSQLRTPGLLKIECEGIAFIGLSPKCYYVLKNESDEHGKFSAKGVQARNQRDILTYKNFYDILHGGGDNKAFNLGIRPINGEMCTYVQQKTGLTRLYVKRICYADKFETSPLLV